MVGTTASSGSRRRGSELERAILEATVQELADVGYAELRMDAVAARAGAGKASLYKRWPNRAALVAAAARHLGATSQPCSPPTGNLRRDLVNVLEDIAQALDGHLGATLRGLVSESPSRAAVKEYLPPELMDSRVEAVATVLRVGVERGTVRPEALQRRLVALGPSLVCHHYLFRGRRPGAEEIAEIVDTILLPLFRVDRR